MNITLKKALVVSALIHFLAITPLYSLDLSRDSIDQKKPMVVDYVTVKEIPEVEVSKSDVRERIQETRKIEVTQKISSKNEKKAPQPKKTDEPAKEEPKKTPLPDVAKLESAQGNAARQESQVKSTKEYIGYYQVIREKIRKKLKESYRYYYREGEVFLAFTLGADGSLLGYEAVRPRSVNDETLTHIATVSLIEAAPFPPFPKVFPKPNMSFNIIISFKKG